jgi:hypothetical protein
MKIKANNAPAFVRHLQTLSTLAGVDYPYPFDVYEKLKRLENRAHRITTHLCNGDGDEDKHETALERIEKSVHKLLPKLGEGAFFINRDPRGYALKIREEKAKELNIHTDWGGYGILAPEF